MPQKPCPFCGLIVSGTALFCEHCGQPLGGLPEGRSPLPQGPDSEGHPRQPVPPLFAMSTSKFIVLCLCTFGLYELYWAYQNWKRIQIASGEVMSPFWRAIFAQLWGFSLFRRIRAKATAAGVPVRWNPNWLAAIYLLFPYIAGYFPGPWVLIGLIKFVVLIPVLRTAQRVNVLQADTCQERQQGSSSPDRPDPALIPPALTATTWRLRPDALIGAGLIAAFLVCWILMAYIGSGLAHELTPLVQALLWSALATTGLGLLAAVFGRTRLSLLGFALTLANLLWQQHVAEQKLAPQRQRDAELRRRENAELLKQAQTQAPCTNGDVAILSKFTNTNAKPSFTSLSLQIVPRDRTQKADILVSASGDFIPPKDDDVAQYRSENHSDCRNTEYSSLDAMMLEVTKHYWAERHKFVR